MQVAKWGNSLAVRLPATVVQALALKEGDDIEIHVSGLRTIEVARKSSRAELLKRLRTFPGACQRISRSIVTRPMAGSFFDRNMRSRVYLGRRERFNSLKVAVRILSFLAWMALQAGPASADCARIPDSVTGYIRPQAGWHMVTTPELGEDQALWTRYHGRQCPGLVRINLTGTAPESYAVALIRQTGVLLQERVELLTLMGTTVSRTTLESDSDLSGPWVIFRAKPGRYTDIETGKRVVLQHEGIIFEKMEAADRLYYRANGRINELTLSD